MKTIALLGSGLAILVLAFFLLPKLALHISGGGNANLPITRVASATAAGTPAGNDPIESFADLTAQAGFTPLDPGVVPVGFVPAASYVDRSPTVTVVFAFRNAAGRYLLISERQGPQRQAGSDSPHNRPIGFAPRSATPAPNAPEFVRLPAGAAAVYFAEDPQIGPCPAHTSIEKYTCGDQPAQSVRFSTRGIEVDVVAAVGDLSRDDLLNTAGGLR